MLLKTSLLTALAAIGLVSAAGPNKPAMSPAIDRRRLKNGLKANLPLTHHTKDNWGAGWIPQGCKRIANKYGLDPHDFTVFNVHYDDCSTPWIFCRHKDARPSQRHMMDMFGRVPVHMRSYIRQFIATPSVDGYAAWTYASGDCHVEGGLGLDLLLHEFSHSLDWNALGQGQYSLKSHWQTEYKKDTHTPTGYGRNSWAEDFAETAMVGVYDKVVPGGFSSMAGNWKQIFHQYTTYKEALGKKIVPQGQCKNRIPNSETVQMGNGRRSETLGPKPDTSISEDIEVLEPHPDGDNVFSNCTVPHSD